MPFQKYTLPIVALVDEAPHVRTFLFDAPEGLTWEPGAHCHVALPGFDEGGRPNRELVRHMSVCTLPEEGKLGFTTRLNSSDSPFKRALAGMSAGDELVFFKFGSILGLPDDGRPVVLLSQGVGIASMRPLVLDFARRREAGGFSRTPSLTSVNVGREGAAIYAAQLGALAAEGLAMTRVTSRVAFEDAVRALPNPAGSVFEVVGSSRFLLSTIALLRSLGVADDSIVLDKKPEKAATFFSA